MLVHGFVHCSLDFNCSHLEGWEKIGHVEHGKLEGGIECVKISEKIGRSGKMKVQIIDLKNITQ